MTHENSHLDPSFNLTRFRLSERPGGVLLREEFRPVGAQERTLANLKLTVEEFGNEYFVTGSVGALHLIIGSCRDAVGYLNVFFVPDVEKDPASELLAREIIQFLKTLGARKLVVRLTSLPALRTLAGLLGKGCLGRPYDELEADISHYGNGEIRVSLTSL